jgi:transcriptional regulator with XRE-family HTH domain
MKRLGDVLRRLREERDLKQKDVADALRISNKILSSYERNVSQPPIDVLRRICDYYQVSADVLLGLASDEPDAQPAPQTAAIPLDADEQKLLYYYHRLDSEGQDAIRGMMIFYCREQERRSASTPEVYS